jgi:hypothetical protein
MTPDTEIAVLRTILEASIYALESGAPRPLAPNRVMFYYRADGQWCASRTWVGSSLVVIHPGASGAFEIEATADDRIRYFHHLWRMGARWMAEFVPTEEGDWVENGEMDQFPEPEPIAESTKVTCPGCGGGFNTLASRELHWTFNPECKPTERVWERRETPDGGVIYMPRYISPKQAALVS